MREYIYIFAFFQYQNIVFLILYKDISNSNNLSLQFSVLFLFYIDVTVYMGLFYNDCDTIFDT